MIDQLFVQMNRIVPQKWKWILEHGGFKKYFKNTSWLFFERALRLGVGLFVSVWMARYLGPADYGLYSYTISFVGLFTIIATFGLDGIVIRDLVKFSDKRDVLLGTAFILKLVGAFISLFVLGGVILFTNHSSFENILIFIVASSVIFQSLNVIDFYFQSKVLSKYIVFSNIISLLFSSFLKIYFILSHASLLSFVWIVLFDSIVLSLGYFYFYKKQGLKLMSWKFDMNMAMSLLRDSWPLILSSIAISVYMRIDQVMIKGMIGDQAVGVYSVAVNLSEVLHFVPILISGSLFPAILNAKKISQSVYHERLKRLYVFVFYLLTFLALIIYFFSHFIIDNLYGSQYIDAVKILRVYVWSSIFVSFGIVNTKWFLSEGLQNTLFFNTVVGAVLNIILNMVLIRLYGVLGAAFSTLVSYSFSSHLINFFNKKTRKIFFLANKGLFNLKI